MKRLNQLERDPRTINEAIRKLQEAIQASVQSSVPYISVYAPGQVVPRMSLSSSVITVGSSYSLGGVFDTNTPVLQVIGTNDPQTSISSARFANSVNCPRWRLAHSRGSTVGNYSIVATDDQFGEIQFLGADGVDFAPGASIIAKCDGVPGSNDMPGRLELRVSADGSASPTTRVTLKADGGLIVGTGTTSGGAGTIIAEGFVKTLSTTVGGLPAAATAGSGARAFVTDANSTVFLAAAVGGGANKVPVVSDGTNWLIG